MTHEHDVHVQLQLCAFCCVQHHFLWQNTSFALDARFLTLFFFHFGNVQLQSLTRCWCTHLPHLSVRSVISARCDLNLPQLRALMELSVEAAGRMNSCHHKHSGGKCNFRWLILAVFPHWHSYDDILLQLIENSAQLIVFWPPVAASHLRFARHKFEVGASGFLWSTSTQVKHVS